MASRSAIAALAAAQIEGQWLAPGAVDRVGGRQSPPLVPPPGFTLLDQRRYGDTIVTLLTAPE
jgi:16S rRNA (guanine966-N2)-methyltransferase